MHETIRRRERRAELAPRRRRYPRSPRMFFPYLLFGKKPEEYRSQFTRGNQAKLDIEFD
jgi:hypothetical protein